MRTDTFTRKAQKSGISLSTISVRNTQYLREIVAEPIKMTPKKSPTGGVQLGPLIKHGLVRLNDERTHYVVTQKGLDYLAEVQSIMEEDG